jgi:hypothetical protein
MLDFVSRRSAERGCRSQAQVSGITFDMVCRGQCGGPQPSACAKNIAIGDNCRNGNPDGPIDYTKCAPLVRTALYRVAVNDYIAAGGSGFDVLKRNTSKQDTGVSLRDSLRVYLNQRNRCTTETVDGTTPVTAKFGNISCLDSTIEAHDGRIRPVFE